MAIRVPHKAYVHSQLASSLREAIKSGEWEDRLPSERVLSGLFRVSRMTMRKALADLEKEKLIGQCLGNEARRILPGGEDTSGAEANYLEVAIVKDPKRQLMPHAEMREHKLRLALARLGIRSEVLYFTTRQMKSGDLNPKNWITRMQRRLWILFSPSLVMQKWFAEHARERTLIVGTSEPSLNLPSIDVDCRAVGRHAGGIFLGRGHRSLAILGLKSPASGDVETEEEFIETIQTHPSARFEIFRHDGTRQDIYHQLDLIIRKRPKITGLFTYKAAASVALLIRLLERGLRLPDDLSLIVRDYDPCFDLFPFDISHYRIEHEVITHYVISQIEQCLDNPARGFSSTRLLSEYKKGDTVARISPSAEQ